MCWDSLNFVSGLIFLKIKQSWFEMTYGHVSFSKKQKKKKNKSIVPFLSQKIFIFKSP